jgi:hypothetical protein
LDSLVGLEVLEYRDSQDLLVVLGSLDLLGFLGLKDRMGLQGLLEILEVLEIQDLLGHLEYLVSQALLEVPGVLEEQVQQGHLDLLAWRVSKEYQELSVWRDPLDLPVFLDYPDHLVSLVWVEILALLDNLDQPWVTLFYHKGLDWFSH